MSDAPEAAALATPARARRTMDSSQFKESFMPEPGLVMWIIGFPFVLAIVDLVRTVMSLKHMPPSATGRGAWSRAVHVRS